MPRFIFTGVVLLGIGCLVWFVVGMNQLLRTQDMRDPPNQIVVNEGPGFDPDNRDPAKETIGKVNPKEPGRQKSKVFQKALEIDTAGAREDLEEEAGNSDEIAEVAPHELSPEILPDFPDRAETNVLGPGNRLQEAEYLLDNIKYAMAQEGIPGIDIEHMTQDLMTHVVDEGDLATIQEELEMQYQDVWEKDLIRDLMDAEVSAEDMDFLLEDLMEVPHDVDPNDVELEHEIEPTHQEEG